MNHESTCQLRQPRPGDIGWILHRHGVLYAQEYGWNTVFESLVAEVCAGFLKSHDPARERCWVADRHGEILGSIFLMAGDDGGAKLRLFYVEPMARGQGVGKALLDACLAFARAADYRYVTLFTTDVLDAARHLYQAAGFRLESEQASDAFGPTVNHQYWRLDL